MLAADQDILAAAVVVDSISHAILVITAAGGVHGEPQIGSERLDGFKRAPEGTICGFCLAYQRHLLPLSAPGFGVSAMM
jgi:hypothetical protein